MHSDHRAWLADYELVERQLWNGNATFGTSNTSNGLTRKATGSSTDWTKLYGPLPETAMGLTATSKSSNFEMTPAGVHPARCFQIIDLGTQTTEFQGDKKSAHKVRIGWELLGEERMADGRPFAIFKTYSVSTHEKSTLRKDLEAWRGKPFTADEISRFEITKVLGVYAFLNVSHTEGKDGNTYANIASIMPLPKGMPKPPGVNKEVVFDLDDRDMQVFESLSDKLKEKIMSCPEWAKSKGDAFEDDIPWKHEETEPEF